jgi:hypothetical protein
MLIIRSPSVSESSLRGFCMKEYDLIIVGTGSAMNIANVAARVLVRRLCENSARFQKIGGFMIISWAPGPIL